jgi:hypothetical protein
MTHYATVTKTYSKRKKFKITDDDYKGLNGELGIDIMIATENKIIEIGDEKLKDEDLYDEDSILEFD